MKPKARPRSFLSYYSACFTAPARTLDSLLKDSRKVRMAALAMLIPSLGYTLM